MAELPRPHHLSALRGLESRRRMHAAQGIYPSAIQEEADSRAAIGEAYRAWPDYQRVGIERERVKESKRQWNLSYEQQQEQNKRQQRSSMVSGIGNLALTYKMLTSGGSAATSTAIAPTTAGPGSILGGGSGMELGAAAGPGGSAGITGAGVGVPATGVPGAGYGAALSEPAATAAGESALSTTATTAPGAFQGVGLGSTAGGVAAGYVGEQIGTELLGETGGEFAGYGSAFVVGTALAGGNPLGGVAAMGAYFVGDVIFEDVLGIDLGSWLCTEMQKFWPVSRSDWKTIKTLQSYSLENHYGVMKFYLDFGPDLVTMIDASEDTDEFYKNFRDDVFNPAVRHIKKGEEEKAYILYTDMLKLLFKKYLPHLSEDFEELLNEGVRRAA